VSAPNVVPFVVTNRQEKLNRAARVPVVRSFISAYHAAGFSGWLQRRFLGWRCWFVGTASEPLLPRRVVERRRLAH